MKAFKLDDYIRFPDEKFDCEVFRYSHRFMPFQFLNSHHYLCVIILKKKQIKIIKFIWTMALNW